MSTPRANLRASSPSLSAIGISSNGRGSKASGRPPPGRSSPLGNLARPSSSGRNSPLLLGKPKVGSSPIMRRMMRSRPNPVSNSSPSTSSPVIRKSASMDSMLPLQAGLNQHNCPEEQFAEEEAEAEDGEECQGLPTNPETRLQPPTPEEEEVEEGRRSEEEAGSVQDSRIARFEEDEDCNDEETHFQEVEQHRATDSATLGRSHSRSKTISRSIVPMMRKMFERAKSCDPDVISPHGDGTESSRSSFSQYQLNPGSGEPHARSVSPAPSSITISECGSSPSMPRARSKGPGSSGLITKIKAKFKSSS